MVFLFDENVPYNFVHGLSFIEDANNKSKNKAKVSHPKDHNIETASDEEIIKLAGKLKATVVTFDKDFKHLKKYSSLYQQHNAGVVFLSFGKKPQDYFGIVTMVITHWEEMKEMVKRLKPPFVIQVSKNGVSQLHF